MKYNQDYKKNAVRLMLNRGSKTVKQIATELGIPDKYLYSWREQFADELGYKGKADGQTEELIVLRKQVRELQKEQAFLKKAAAFFASEKL